MRLIVILLLGAILAGCAAQSTSSKDDDQMPYRPMDVGPTYQPGHPMLP